MSDRFRPAIIALLSLTVALLLLPGFVAPAQASSCIGLDACAGNTGEVGAGACIGDLGCLANAGDIATTGCHDRRACYANSGLVGQGACHGEGACDGNRGDVRKAACGGYGACVANAGAVGEGACVGVYACERNAGDIGKLSCRGNVACAGREGLVGEGACIGDAACQNSGSGPIGKGACRGDRACYNNPHPIPKGACVGPPMGGVGVCETIQSVGIDVNTMVIKGVNIVSMQYIENSLHVTPGKAVGLGPQIIPDSPEFFIMLEADRQGSTSVADSFNQVTGGAGHVWSTYAFLDNAPSELNFYFGMNLFIVIDEVTYTVPVYFGQGHTWFDNNWWIGGGAVTATDIHKPAQLTVGGSSYPAVSWGINGFVIEF